MSEAFDHMNEIGEIRVGILDTRHNVGNFVICMSVTGHVATKITSAAERCELPTKKYHRCMRTI